MAAEWVWIVVGFGGAGYLMGLAVTRNPRWALSPALACVLLIPVWFWLASLLPYYDPQMPMIFGIPMTVVLLGATLLGKVRWRAGVASVVATPLALCLYAFMSDVWQHK
ncbi:hypothetical protein DAETH_13260 [Deinococcus aetherius]|uniref:Uncharacterized protein n=1 Tax=Deinococcus aetherius TaxID=200252 RepID=A0ABN6RDB4_9DEIO|nr:hypothetical protein [Deinococcus aetherius]BDP41357.1 hypothetical protein DAETH_13260 [Deinococcus aetherius]